MFLLPYSTSQLQPSGNGESTAKREYILERKRETERDREQERDRQMMEGKGGCCIARYVGGAYIYDLSKLDKIMLQFRPIAPKPISPGSLAGVSTVNISDHVGKTRKGKRKYVKESLSCDKKRCKSRRRASPEQIVEPVVTLPLLPETPERKDSPARGSPVNYDKELMNSPVRLSFNNQASHVKGSCGVGSADPTVEMTPQSRVTMECLTHTWTDGNELGLTDEERKRNLELDTCPGFISDGRGKVTWTNRAYKEMVGHGGERESKVWLVMKERVPLEDGMSPWPGFTCRVRVQYTCGKDRNSLTVPCDVWRMDGCGVAWRLDVQAALCLGR